MDNDKKLFICSIVAAGKENNCGRKLTEFLAWLAEVKVSVRTEAGGDLMIWILCMCVCDISHYPSSQSVEAQK